MNRLLLGTLLGVAFGVADVLITLRGAHAHTTAMLLQAFFSRFAIGFLAANVSLLKLHPALAGAIVGLLISLPDAFALKSYAGILGTGLVFGAMAGWATDVWGAKI